MEWKKRIFDQVVIYIFTCVNNYIPTESEVEKDADDILCYITGKHRPNLPQDEVVKWWEENKMRLNIKICKILVSTQVVSLMSKLMVKKLDVVDEYKYFGFNLTSSLDWDQQWFRVKKIIRSIPYLIKHLKRIWIKTSISINVHRSYALSHFLYGLPLLILSSINAKLELGRFQTRILRIINISLDIA